MPVPLDDERREALYDAYLDAALRGPAPDPEEFLRREGVADQELLIWLQRLRAEIPSARPSRVMQDANQLWWERLGRFRLQRSLGEGAMGLVYEALDERTGNHVALKVIRPELAASTEVRSRFAREAEVLTRLCHPGLARVVAHGEDHGVCFLALELIDGDDLEAWVQRARERADGSLVRDILGWMRDIARALEAAHAAGVIHRDVKPANIRITSSGRAVLLDFGLALELECRNPRFTRGFVGSPPYAAPEQLDPQRGAIDARTDVYALGVSLYELLGGRLPFAVGSPESCLRQILWVEPEPLRRLCPELPRDLSTVVAKAMEKRPSDRYASAAELAEDLDALLSLRPIRARSPSFLRRAQRWSARHRATAAGLCAAVIVALGFALALTLQGHRDSAERAAEGARRLGESQQLFGVVHRLREESEAARWSAERLRAERQQRPLRPEEESALLELEREAEQKDYERAERLLAALTALAAAERLLPESDELRDARARSYFERWMDTRRSPHASTSTDYRASIDREDPTGRWRQLVAGRVKLQVDSEPPGAAVYLYRYVDRALISHDRDARLVPAPAFGEPSSWRAGEEVLLVLENRAALRAGDLVLSIDGQPVLGGSWIAEDAPPLLRGDRLRSIGGESASLYAAEELDAVLRAEPASRELVVSRNGAELRFGSAAIATAAPRWVDAPLFASDERAQLELWRDGARSTAFGASDLALSRTAAPAAIEPQRLYGVTPIAPRSCDPGWYLAVLHREGYEALRVSFHVDHAVESYANDVRMAPRLLRDGTTPAGFVYISDDAYQPKQRGYWIQRYELTAEEYLAFLNAQDPSLAASTERELAPRSGENMTWPHDEHGRFALPSGLPARTPVIGISWSAAERYARWKNESAPCRLGDFDLPTVHEWRRAAYGGDGRDFVFGNHFASRWTSSRFARSRSGPAPIGTFPIDESPCGVLDLAGNAAEWCRGGREDELRWLLGGAWSDAGEEPFRIASERRWPSQIPRAEAGLRLVLRRNSDG